MANRSAFKKVDATFRQIYADLTVGTGERTIELVREDPSLLTATSGGRTPLGHAIRYGQVAAVEAMLELSANPRNLDAADSNPGHLLAATSTCSLERKQQIAQLLASRGHPIDWSSRNNKGQTALDVAFAESSEATVEWVWAQGGGLGQAAQGADSALTRAVRLDRPDWWDRLLAEGAPLPRMPSLNTWHRVITQGLSALETWGPRFKRAGIAQLPLRGPGLPLDAYLRGPTVVKEIERVLSWLDGRPSDVTYAALVAARRLELLEIILPKYSLPDTAPELMWRAVLDGFKKLNRGDLPNIILRLLEHGILPTGLQRDRLFLAIRDHVDRLSVFNKDQLVALFSVCSQAGLRVPWTLRTVIAHWPHTEVVQAWLAHHRHKDALTMVKATGLLEQISAEDWPGVLKPLLVKRGRRRDAPAPGKDSASPACTG